MSRANEPQLRCIVGALSAFTSPSNVRRIPEECPEAAWRLYWRCTAPDPARRPSSSELVDLLRELQPGPWTDRAVVARAPEDPKGEAEPSTDEEETLLPESSPDVPQETRGDARERRKGALSVGHGVPVGTTWPVGWGTVKEEGGRRGRAKPKDSKSRGRAWGVEMPPRTM
jgi:hypothetical protein